MRLLHQNTIAVFATPGKLFRNNLAVLENHRILLFPVKSIFSETLIRLIHLEGISQLELSRRSGVENSIISRLCRGRAPSRVQLGRLVAAISNDHRRQLELLFSHLYDEAASCSIAGITQSHFRIISADEDSPRFITLAAELELIADECSQHEDLRNFIVDTARIILRHRAELLDAAGEKLSFPVGEAVPPSLPADQVRSAQSAKRAREKNIS